MCWRWEVLPTRWFGAEMVWRGLFGSGYFDVDTFWHREILAPSKFQRRNLMILAYFSSISVSWMRYLQIRTKLVLILTFTCKNFDSSHHRPHVLVRFWHQHNFLLLLFSNRLHWVSRPCKRVNCLQRYVGDDFICPEMRKKAYTGQLMLNTHIV